MIISEKRKYVYHSVPKACTRTMYHVLTKYFDGSRTLKNGQKLNWHVARIVKGTEKYFRFSVCRNPYARFISSWFVCWHNPKWNKILSGKMGQPCKDMYAMLKYLKKGNHILLTRPQTKHLEKLNISTFIKIENIIEGIKTLPFYVDEEFQVPKIGSTPHAPWKSYLDKEKIELINEIYAQDFKILGYERL